MTSAATVLGKSCVNLASQDELIIHENSIKGVERLKSLGVRRQHTDTAYRDKDPCCRSSAEHRVQTKCNAFLNSFISLSEVPMRTVRRRCLSVSIGDRRVCK
jgi:hypothetical protein